MRRKGWAHKRPIPPEPIDYAIDLKPLVMNWITFHEDTTDYAPGVLIPRFTSTIDLVEQEDGRDMAKLDILAIGGSPNESITYLDNQPGINGITPCVIGPQFGWAMGLTVEFSAIPDMVGVGSFAPFAGNFTLNSISAGTGLAFGFYTDGDDIYLAAVGKRQLIDISLSVNTIKSLSPVQPNTRYILHTVYNRAEMQMEFYINHELQGVLDIGVGRFASSGNYRASLTFGGSPLGTNPFTMYLRDFFYAIDGFTSEMLQWMYDGNPYLRPYADVKAAVYTETLEDHISLWFKDYVKFNGDTTNYGNAGRGDATLVNSEGGDLPILDVPGDTPLPGDLAGDGYLVLPEALQYAQYDPIDMTSGGMYGAVAFTYNDSNTGFGTEPHFMKWGLRYRNTPTTPANYYGSGRLWSNYFAPFQLNHNPNGSFFIGNRSDMMSSGNILTAPGGLDNNTWNHICNVRLPRSNNTYNAVDQGYSVLNGRLTMSHGLIFNLSNGFGEYNINLTHILSGGSTSGGPGQKYAHVGNLFGGNDIPHPSYFVKLYHLLTGY